MTDIGTPTVGRRFRRRLTDTEIDRVRTALRTGGPAEKGPAAAIVELWDIILAEAEGTTYTAAQGANMGLHPRNYAIPSDQADMLLEMLKGRRGARVQRSVRYTWMNIGPATYDDPEGAPTPPE